MSFIVEKETDKNPRILDLRQKLDEITKKQDRNVDKHTKTLINDITQRLDDKGESESGPYSLLLDLQSEPSTSKENTREKTDTEQPQRKYFLYNKSVDRLPNVINLEDKPLKEYEYSCENELTIPVKRTFNVHSRSELCLHFNKPSPQNRIETTSPNDNSITRTNEENSLDDSLGILTPDQMDDICYLENSFSPTVEGLPSFCDNESGNSPDNGDTPSTDKTESNSAASTMFLQHDMLICKDKNNTKLSDFTYFIPTVSLNLPQCSDDNNTSQISETVTYTSKPQFNLEENIQEGNASECIISVKEELVTCFLEDELLPSVHSSILEPVSSIADTTVNLDLPLDCKNNETRSGQRIEQTPSPEELPLDNSDIHGEISTYSNSQISASTLHDSHTFSDIKNEFTKSIETSKVSNSFITSITSITSLDGYQGDGELSRPVSRGADHSIREEIIEMDWQNIPVTRRADPMTDSDFFTESDADGLDDIQRGDRRAQVIDGALYGGKNNNGNPPLIVNRSEDSCMDSSGVYTDFENHRSSPVFLNAIDDMSPDGSSPSTRSECSQNNEKNNQANDIYPRLGALKEDSSVSYIINKEIKSNSKRNSLNNDKEERVQDRFCKDEKRSFTLKKYKMPKRDVPSKIKLILNTKKTDTDTSVQNSPKTVKKTERRENLSKKNAPNDMKNELKMKSFKDVKSKVDCSFSLQRSQTACSVTRMLSSKSPNTNIKPKSRHLRMRMDLASANGSGKSSLHSSQSDISATSTPLGKHSTSRFPLHRNGKKRESAPAPAPAQSPPSRGPSSPQQPSPVTVKKNGVVQKLSSSPVAVRARAALSLAPAPSSPRKPAAARRVPAQRPTTLPTNKEPPRVSAAVGPRGKRQGAQTPQVPPAPLARASPAPAPLPLPAAVPAPAPTPTSAQQAAALAHSAKGFEALGVLVQYLVFQRDALNSTAWRQEAARWRGVAAAERSSAARADQDRQQRAQKDLDTIAECLSKISELEMEVSAKEEVNARLQQAGAEADHQYRATLHEVTSLAAEIKGLKITIETLKREVSESRARLHAQGEIERTLRAQLEAAREEFGCGSPAELPAAELPTHCDSAATNGYEECEYHYSSRGELSTDANELAAEVRSLRAVLELKQAETASLRGARTELAAERERRARAEREARAARHAAEELRERAAARQREADRLREEGRKLREGAARDRDHAGRLAALNEELRYKLRQKSQVVSLLAGGGYLERSLRPRTASCDSARSPSPSPPPPPPPPAPPSPSPASPATMAPRPAPAASPPASPAVKAVVEKQDSVSWVLEIEETPQEVASRLARRSSFRTVASPGATKRRGGTSPGNGSPAPASPAPNASKLFRPGDLDFPPAPPPLKESAGEAIYIWQGSDGH